MTPEEQMKAIVESVDGGCWHDTGGYVGPSTGAWHCRKCNAMENTLLPNPSPTDMNDLFWLAKKIGVDSIQLEILANTCLLFFADKDPIHVGTQDTPADALRSALYQAVKGEG